MKTIQKWGLRSHYTGYFCTARLLAAAVAVSCSAAAQASSSDFWYSYAPNRTIVILGYHGSGGVLTIPETIDGLPVAMIWSGAFKGCVNLTTITIPKSVTSIGAGAFSGCTALTNITIPNSVTSIGNSTFSDCTSLNNITIPNSVTNIGSGAFYGCTSLFNVAIGNGVTTIGSTAFNGCANLTTITIPDSVNSIGESAFSGCCALATINVAALNNSYSSVDGVLFNKSQTTLIHYPWGKSRSYTIPDSVINIADGTFASCTGLMSLTIPDSWTSIGNSTFSGCTSLTSITIPNSVTSIESHAFSGCTSLTSVTIGSGVITIGDRAFYGCANLIGITVDALNAAYSSVDGVLFDKSKTTLVQCPQGKAGIYTIPNGVTTITGRRAVFVPLFGIYVHLGNAAFEGCTRLTSVVIPDSVTGIGGWVFSDCPSLRGAYFQGKIPSVDGELFSGADNVTVYYLPGTAGWGATFAGQPTALWFPQAQIEPTIGVQINRFGFTINWASDKVVIVEAATDLAKPIWTPVSTNTLTGGTATFGDPDWAQHPRRFYRMRAQ